MMVVGRRNRLGRNIALGIAVAVLLIWSVVPVYWIVVTSLKHEQEIYAYPPTFLPLAPTLEQYATILFHTPFPLFIRNSAVIAVATTACAIVAGTLAAYAISRMRFIGRAMVARMIVVAYLLPPSLLFIPCSSCCSGSA